jgi:MFS family permease
VTSNLAALRSSAFRRLLVGRTVVHLGNAVAPVALAFAVLDLTGSTSDLALVVAARSIANVALLLAGGVLADRLPRAAVLTGAQLLAALGQAAVAALVLTGTATVPLLVLLGALNGAATAASFPATAALVPQTVPIHLVRSANALSRLGVSGAAIGGAAAGGLIVAAAGPGWGLALDALTFAVAALCFAGIGTTDLRVDALSRAPSERASVLGDLKQGWVEVRQRTWLCVVMAQSAVVNAVLAGGLVVLGPVVADAGPGRAAWGLLLAAQSAGLVAGGLLALRWMPVHALAWGAGLSALAAAPLFGLGGGASLPVLLLAFFAAGVAMEQFGVAWDVSLQEQVPADRLARVYSIDAVGSFVAMPLGQIAAAPLSEWTGVAGTLQAAGLLIVAATTIALLSRDLRGLRRSP